MKEIRFFILIFAIISSKVATKVMRLKRMAPLKDNSIENQLEITKKSLKVNEPVMEANSKEDNKELTQLKDRDERRLAQFISIDSDSKQRFSKHHHHNKIPKKRAKSEFTRKLQEKIHLTESLENELGSPIDTGYINTEDSLNQIIKSTVGYQLSSNGSIIVINQPIPMGSTSFNNNLLKEMSDYKFGPYPSTAGYIKGAMVFEEVDPLITLLERTKAIYQDYYNLLPDRSNVWAMNTIDEQKLNMVKFYQKVNEFSKNFIQTRDELENNMLFSISRLMTLRKGKDWMLKFYGFFNEWRQLENRGRLYAPIDQNFKVLNARLGDGQVIFDGRVGAIAGDVPDYQRIYEHIEQEINNLVNVQMTNPVSDAIDKFNRFLRLIIKLNEMRSDLMNVINRIQTKLQGFKNLKQDLANLYSKYNELVVNHEKKQEADLKKSNSYINQLKTNQPRKSVSILISALILFFIPLF